MDVTVEKIKQLREKTGLSMMLVRKALIEAGGNEDKAIQVLSSYGEKIAKKKGGRTIKCGIVDSYIHHNKLVGVLALIRCETDFVAKNADFQKDAHKISMHIAAMGSENVEQLLEENFIQDESKKISDLVSDMTAMYGENIAIEDFVRYSIS